MLTVLVILILIGYFIYKEWPEFKKRVSSGAVNEEKESQSGRSIEERLGAIEKRLGSLDEKLQRDYDRLNAFEMELRRNRSADRDDLEEREIIMRSLLGIIEGLQEIGANGPTKAAQKEIMDYLNRKTHKADS